MGLKVNIYNRKFPLQPLEAINNFRRNRKFSRIFSTKTNIITTLIPQEPEATHYSANDQPGHSLMEAGHGTMEAGP